ncbi:unnamed protein product [Auanema sp. JU1783]|nr:unnamed protein product [Auanema sp. JU1783]
MPCCGPGYLNPSEATVRAPKETVLFVTSPHADGGNDMLVAVNVDSTSNDFCKIVSKIVFPNKGDEVHHTGWNACSSCYDKPDKKRSHLIIPCLNSSRIYVVNVENEKNLILEKTIEPSLLKGLNVSFPHTSHCLANGQIMISTLGDADDNQSGNFLLLNGQTFDPVGTWTPNPVAFNYDFWYQPRHDVMISTEWGAPHKIKKCFNPADVAEGFYGHSIHVFQWSTHEKLQTIELPMPNGALPLEVRFKHEPSSPHAFVGTALGSAVYHLEPEVVGSKKYKAVEVIKIPDKEVTGWALLSMPGLITDILISMDDQFLFISCWLHGDIRQYDIRDPSKPVLVSSVFIGGSIHKESGVVVTKDSELQAQPDALYVKNKKVEGGPQMLQLSLDGKRLYVTTSLYSIWDKQFYPKLSKTGAMLLQIDVTDDGMKLNPNFLVDFSTLEGGPYLAHEMRYPGGDCTSDIWV